MATVLNHSPAGGAPGIEPRWTRSDKNGVGTAYSALSRVWFTVSKGILNEVYYPTIDRPQIRDLQYLITDGESFLYAERELEDSYEFIAPGVLGFRIINSAPDGSFRIIKEVISDPYQDCVLLHTRIEAAPELLKKLRVYVMLAPHLEVGGWGNSGNVVKTDGGRVLTAHKGSTWLALSASTPFARCSCGYAGVSDGWNDLKQDYVLQQEFDCAPNGNIALLGELDLRQSSEFVLALAFGESLHHALVTVAQALGSSFSTHRDRFIEHWQLSARHVIAGKEQASGDGGELYCASHAIILAHEDKTYNGAIIASLSIPWGEAAGDDNLGGYHLVWTRDMCHSATGLMAAGDTEAPLRALIYLACSQNEDGGFYQNFWIDGEPHWRGIQLDEVALPIILAWRLMRAEGLQEFDPYPMVLKAAGYLIERGPVTPQERWEENSGFSPSTLAAHIAALICAADFARSKGESGTAAYFEEYADFLRAHVETWTVVTDSTLVPGVERHFIRLHPALENDPLADEAANNGELNLRNQPPGERCNVLAREVVDAGFLELVRYGVVAPNDPLVEDSLRVIDALLKVETLYGPCWRRYNHDGYGQKRDGGPFEGWGYGHAWPVLTGERGHYELAAGRDVTPYIQAMEGFASSTKLIPEQVWALPDLPQAHMFLGRATGGAMPLVWAHAEYLKLVRSSADGRVFDLLPPVAARYADAAAESSSGMELWKFNRQVQGLSAGQTLRVQARAAFLLHWSADEWATCVDTTAARLATGHYFADIVTTEQQRAALKFTFLWTDAGNWEGRDFQVSVSSV